MDDDQYVQNLQVDPEAETSPSTEHQKISCELLLLSSQMKATIERDASKSNIIKRAMINKLDSILNIHFNNLNNSNDKKN